MGADLYLNTLHGPQHEKWNKVFERLCAERDGMKAGPARDAVQKKVDHAFDQMHAKGYFRDSYNFSSVAWRMGLSWWKDITPMLNKEGGLPIPKAKQLLARIQKTPVKPCTDEEIIERGCKPTDEGWEPKGWTKMWKRKRLDLIALLKQSIALNEPIDCSL